MLVQPRPRYCRKIPPRPGPYESPNPVLTVAKTPRPVKAKTTGISERLKVDRIPAEGARCGLGAHAGVAHQSMASAASDLVLSGHRGNRRVYGGRVGPCARERAWARKLRPCGVRVRTGGPGRAPVRIGGASGWFQSVRTGPGVWSASGAHTPRRVIPRAESVPGESAGVLWGRPCVFQVWGLRSLVDRSCGLRSGVLHRRAVLPGVDRAWALRASGVFACAHFCVRVVFLRFGSR